MAIINPPAWMQQGSYPARTDRNVLAGLISASGVVSTTDMVVSQTPSPSMTLSVSAGYAFIHGTTIARQGVYHVMNDANVDVGLQASNSTNPRIDLVILRIYDADVSGVLNEARYEVVTGTPAPIPTVPTLPASSIELARVTVPAGATGITTANINIATKPLASLRPSLVTSPILITSSSRPTSPYSGQQIYETDTRITRVRASGVWRHTGGHPLLSASRIASAAIPGSTWSTFPALEQPIVDDLGSFNASTGEFTVPITGQWLIDIKAEVGSQNSATQIATRLADANNNQLNVATRDLQTVASGTGSGNNQPTRFATIVLLSAGTVVRPQYWHNGAVSHSFSNFVFSATLMRANDA